MGVPIIQAKKFLVVTLYCKASCSFAVWGGCRINEQAEEEFDLVDGVVDPGRDNCDVLVVVAEVGSSQKRVLMRGWHCLVTRLSKRILNEDVPCRLCSSER